jgi:hypothetical protein
MAGDPVHEYLDAKGKRDKLAEEIEGMSGQLLGAGQKLRGKRLAARNGWWLWWLPVACFDAHEEHSRVEHG